MKIGLHEEMSPVESEFLETGEDTSTEKSPDLHWMELALDDPLFTVSYIRASGTHLYSVDIFQNQPTKKGTRNIDFEFVYPLHCIMTDIIEAGKTTKTSRIKVLASSREHWNIVYVKEFPVDEWSYTQMDYILEGLAEQLTMRQNLNRGLLVQVIFIE